MEYHTREYYRVLEAQRMAELTLHRQHHSPEAESNATRLEGTFNQLLEARKPKFKNARLWAKRRRLGEMSPDAWALLGGTASARGFLVDD